MTDILNPVETHPVYCVGVRHKGRGPVQFIAEYRDHLTALKHVNKWNLVRGLTTGDVYVLEEMEVNGL